MSAASYRGAQSQTKQEAGHSHKHWADDELAIITRPDLSIKQAALMLGRTYASVARKRSRLRHTSTPATPSFTTRVDRPSLLTNS